ncbi:hypothetical protein [Streptomyces sp. PKU-EA00015]|uniref:MmyB family transcriptional regulator n=1 Tax=Streptomyces sp. PKU-EA00015 TaxID=2748326 RepID=UPI0028124856|nr:hypothetical protein [Streptomyces sp. PKU-EA00015]
MEAGRNPHDQRMAALVGELSMRDDDFRRRRGERDVSTRSRGSKVLRHPVTGDLALDWDALACAHDPDQRLVVWTAEPGTLPQRPADPRLLGHHRLRPRRVCLEAHVYDRNPYRAQQRWSGRLELAALAESGTPFGVERPGRLASAHDMRGTARW